MRITPMRIAGSCALIVTLATSVAACGNDDKKNACDKLQETITQVSQSGITQNNDPNALANTYYSSASALRQEGRDSRDGDVESAANDAASTLEQLSRQLTAGDRGGPPPMSATTSLMSAGDRIRAACDS